MVKLLLPNQKQTSYTGQLINVSRAIHLLRAKSLILSLMFVFFHSLAKSQEKNTFKRQESIQALWQNEPFGAQDLSKEIVEKRDAFSKHFANENGTISAHIASGPINYQENGQWLTIFHTISPGTNGFENVHNAHKTYYPATAAGSIKTILPSGSAIKDMIGMRMYYEADGQEIQSQNIQGIAGQANFNELTYANVYGAGIDLRLTQNTTQRKMDYIIQHANALGNIPAGAQFLVFEESVELPQGWKAELKENVIYLLDEIGIVQAKYEKPVFEENHASENQQEGIQNEKKENARDRMTGNYAIVQHENMLVIKTNVPLSWLTAAERRFPIIIDPTIDFPTTNASYWVRDIASDGYDYGGLNWFMIGTDGCCFVSGSIKFNIASIPVGANVSAVDGYINYYAIDGNSPGSRTYEWRNSADPVAVGAGTNATRAALYSSTTTTYSGTLSPTGSAGWKISAFNATGVGAVQSNIGGAVSCGVVAIGTWNLSMGWDFRGYGHVDRPFLRITYTTESITLDGVTVSAACWTTNGSNTYTITAKATGSSPTTIGGNTYGMLALVNLQGTYAGQYGGYYAWNTTQALLTAAGYTQNQMACTGGGWVGMSPGYGGGTATLISATTSVTGNQRTVDWVIRPNTIFPSTPYNSVSQYGQTAGGIAVGWNNNANLFSSLAPITGTTTLCSGGTSQLASSLSTTAISGGSVSTAAGYRVHSFLSSGTLTVPAGFTGKSEVLVVAGGGGGGTRHAGGGGAGGLINNTEYTLSGNQTVTVGSGGGAGANGQNSVFGSLTAIGGGFGSSNGAQAGSGGSGGGGSNNLMGMVGTAGQGNRGGNQGCSNSTSASGCISGCGGCYAKGCGGGGAGAAGGDSPTDASAGGVGLSISITGTAVFYAGGGGGGTDGVTSFAGGNGGGGTGGRTSSLNGTNGTDNTGGGGGGGGANGTSSGTGGTGGSGIAIVRYPTPGTWSSSNTSVATVDANTGMVTAVGSGIAVITYTNASGCFVSTSVTVGAPTIAPTIVSNPDPIPCSGNVTLSTGLVAHYPFASDLNDVSGSGLNLSGTGNFTNGGLNLSSIYQSASTNILNNDNHTISFYINFTTAPNGTWQKIFGYEPAGSDRSPGLWRHPGTMQLHWRYDGANTGGNEPFLYALNQWYHVVGVKNGANFSIYINGVLSESATVANPKAAGNAPLSIGGASGTILKDFRIFNRSLSAAEAQNIPLWQSFSWFSASCGGTAEGTGTSITKDPAATTTYYLRAANGCGSSTCNSIVVTRPPSAPVIGTITQPTCATATGSVALSGLPASGTWTLTRTPGAVTSTGTGTTTTVSGLAQSTTYTWTVSNGTCTSSASANAVLNAQPTTPTASLTTTGSSACHGNTVSLGGNVTAVGAWTLTLSDGTTTTGTGNISWSATVTPSATTTYSISSIATACPGTVSGTTTVTLPPKGTSLAANNESATCVVSGTQPIFFYAPSGNYLGSINPNGRTGTITMTGYTGSASTQDACAAPGNVFYRTAYMGRKYKVTAGALTGSGSLRVAFPFYSSDLSDLISAAGTTVVPTGGSQSGGNPNDNLNDRSGLKVTKHSGGTETGSSSDICNGGTVVLLTQAGNGALSLTPSISGEFVSFDISSFSQFFFHGSGNNSPLPVSLASFSANCNEKDQTELRWSTLSEQNSDKFIVEKSRDMESWSFVSAHNAAGNSSTQLNYTATDETPFNGISYYHLVQKDLNGAEKIYGPVSVLCNEKEINSMVVFPNPTTGSFTVEISSSSSISNAAIQLVDITGKIISTRKINVVEGNNLVLFDGLNLQMGSYMVKLTTESGEFKPVKVVVN